MRCFRLRLPAAPPVPPTAPQPHCATAVRLRSGGYIARSAAATDVGAPPSTAAAATARRPSRAGGRAGGSAHGRHQRQRRHRALCPLMMRLESSRLPRWDRRQSPPPAAPVDGCGLPRLSRHRCGIRVVVAATAAVMPAVEKQEPPPVDRRCSSGRGVIGKGESPNDGGSRTTAELVEAMASPLTTPAPSRAADFSPQPHTP